MQAAIKAIEYHLPTGVLTNTQLANEYPEWSVDKIEAKTGIVHRHIAASEECASDLALEAANKLFGSGVCRSSDIDFVLFCTQSPDYFLPTTACILQERLSIPTTAGAFDFNLGCSGFVYGLGVAKGLVETGQARNVLLLTAETYSKYIHPADRSVRTLFGDGAAATLITAGEEDDGPRGQPALGPFVYGTDGKGSHNLIVPAGGMRKPRSSDTAMSQPDKSGNIRSLDNLFMDGSEIFSFTLRAVPRAVGELLEKTGLSTHDVDLYVFHQANKHMLDHLRTKMRIPEERFYVALRESGNTVSATIPIALKEALNDGTVRPGQRIMVVGFGVGYSWAAGLLRWVYGPTATA